MGFKRPFYGQRITQTSARELVLPPDTLQKANESLTACNAYIRLVRVVDNSNEEHSKQTDEEVRVGVEWVNAPPHTYHSDLNEVNARETGLHVGQNGDKRQHTTDGFMDSVKSSGSMGPPVRLWTDCFRITAAACGGDLDVVGNDARTEKGIEAVVTGKTLHAVGKVPGENVNIASRLASAVVLLLSESEESEDTQVDSKKRLKRPDLDLNFKSEKGARSGMMATKFNSPMGPPGILHAISGFEKGKLKHVQTSVRTLGCVDGKGQKVVVQDEKLQRAWNNYGDLYLKASQRHDEGHRDVAGFAQNLGVNEYCKPKAGEMLVTVPATFAKSWGRFVESNYNPNFHFAPCVLVDEEENVVVTLENWSVNDHLTYNDKWAFCVYSLMPRSNGNLRTYHETLTGTGGYGNIALTFCARFV